MESGATTNQIPLGAIMEYANRGNPNDTQGKPTKRGRAIINILAAGYVALETVPI